MSKENDGWRKLTIPQFMREFRPDGKGRMLLDNEVISEFTEIVCDLCNAEINDEEGKETHIYISRGYGICEDCHKRRGGYHG